MDDLSVRRLATQHLEVSRRFFLQLGAVGFAGLGACGQCAAADDGETALAQVVGQLEYLTKAEDFRQFGRGKPAPHTLSPEQRLAVGLDPRTWQLEVIADPDSNAHIARPMTREAGTALDWSGLLELAKQKAVRYLKVMTCTNVGQPLGMGLWEGIPLRDVIWMCQPVTNIRRVFYYGYHNDDPAQRFQSSLPIGRVLEDLPGQHPVIVCYKLNDQWLTPAGGAPARIVVPDEYGNRSVKWLQRIVLTNEFKANDTYAEWNNDTVSYSKTYARFLHVPRGLKAGQPIPITGLAQVGVSGLSKVQYHVQPEAVKPSENDPYFTEAAWQDAACLPPPEDWGGGLPDGKLPPIPRQFDPETGRPLMWPLRDTIVHWAVLAPGVPAGKYVVRCRTLDVNGIAQPMPRPFPKSGANGIQSEPLTVEG